MNKTNIDYWNKVLESPSNAYKELFLEEIKFLKHVIYKKGCLLDIGCWNGRIINEIKDIAEKIIGIDIDKQALKESIQKFKNNKKIIITEWSAFALPFSDKEFDNVLLMDTLVNFSNNKLKVLSEMKRVLKDKWSMIVSVYWNDAFEERKIMYEKIWVPIKEIVWNTFIFDKSIWAYESEQFSIKELKILFKSVWLSIKEYTKTKIAFICALKKI